MGVFDIMRRAEWDHWRDTGYWLVPTLVGGLMPLWGVYVVLSLFFLPPSLDTFIQSGELLFFTTSILSAAFYTITREPSVLERFAGMVSRRPSSGGGSFPGYRLFGTLILLLTVVCALLFSGTAIARIPGLALSLNVNLLRRWTIAISIVAFMLCFAVALIDNSWTDVGKLLTEARGEQLEQLGQRFDETETD